MQQVTALAGGYEVGWLRWHNAAAREGYAAGEITALGVAEAYQRQGVATRMFAEAARFGPVVHSRVRTRAGEAWARAVGGELPPLRERGYLADMDGPPVKYAGARP